MNIPGPRPRAEPIRRGKWEPLTVYLIGDTVTWEGKLYRAAVDLRSGYLEPPLVIADGFDYWEDAKSSRKEHEVPSNEG
jgi:hypothetical protein